MSHSGGTEVARAPRHPLLRAVAAISTVAGWVAAAMIFASVLITCHMIVVRLSGRSTIWQTEAVVYLMIAATLIGLPYVQRLRGHVNVDLVPLALPAGPRRALALFVLGVSILLTAVALWFGWEYWYFAYERNWRSQTVWAVRLWIPYLALPVGLALFLLQLVADFVAVLLRIDDPFGIGKP